MTEERALVPREWEEVSPAEIIESVVIGGDLSKLTPPQRVAYYARVCESLGLNPYTRPFDYLWLGKDDDRKLVLYAKRDATDQIRRNIGINIVGLDPAPEVEGLFGIVAHARSRDGREDASTAYVPVTFRDGKRMTGEWLANAMMKCETKAKRRVTLSLAGLGLLDETEVGSIPDGVVAAVDESGVLAEPPATVSDVIAARVAALQATGPDEGMTVAGTIEERTDEADAPLPREAEPEGLTKATDTAEDGSTHVEPEPEPEQPEPAMTLEAFVAFVARGYDRDAVRSTARELYPESTGFRQLSEQQLAVLAEAVSARYPLPAPAEAPEESEEEILAAVMSVDESAALAARCGNQSPFSDSVCEREPDHAGAHKAGETESW